MPQEWFEVQRHLGKVNVARQHYWPSSHPQGQALVQMVCCGICAADVRVVTGDKASSGNPQRFITLGHEGVGRILSMTDDSTGLRSGDYVVILPHVHASPDHNSCKPPCSSPSIDPGCIGNGHTLHMGWDIDGCFADLIVAPVKNLIRIPQENILFVNRYSPDLQEALFALTEPMLCTLSAYELIDMQCKALGRGSLSIGRALVIGCGPIGALHSIVLLERGFDVWFMDISQKRMALAQWCVDHRGHYLERDSQHEDFDLVMITASSANAVRMGETLVHDGGIVYLFAGLNAMDRAAMDAANIFFYERLHRTTKGFLTTARLIPGEKSILYLGHSGYFERLAPQAIATLTKNVIALDRMVTGVIPGLTSPCIAARLPGGIDWETEDGSPAIISVLQGADFRERHCKLLMRAGNQL
jgi:threonine dehydrogenase-like Zn-dependent dehydrogenase